MSLVFLSDILIKFKEISRKGENMVRSGHITSSTYNGSEMFEMQCIWFNEKQEVISWTRKILSSRHLCHHMAASWKQKYEQKWFDPPVE